MLPYFALLIAINTATAAIAVVQNQSQVLLLGQLVVVRATCERLLIISAAVPLLGFEQSAFYDPCSASSATQ